MKERERKELGTHREIDLSVGYQAVGTRGPDTRRCGPQHATPHASTSSPQSWDQVLGRAASISFAFCFFSRSGFPRFLIFPTLSPACSRAVPLSHSPPTCTNLQSSPGLAGASLTCWRPQYGDSLFFFFRSYLEAVGVGFISIHVCFQPSLL